MSFCELDEYDTKGLEGIQFSEFLVGKKVEHFKQGVCWFGLIYTAKMAVSTLEDGQIF